MNMLNVLLLLVLLVTQSLRPVSGLDSSYSSRPGDTLFQVARSHGLGLEHVAWANNRSVDMNPLPPREYIIPLRRILPRPLPEGLVLNLPERGIFHFRGGQFQRFYPVAIGMPGWNTPVGEFRIAMRTVDPTWVPPAWAGGGAPVGPGPANPLGDRWLGLGYRGYGIHGTNRPDSIGGAVSHGCIRMYPELVRQLYDQVQVGTSVRIEYEPVKTAWNESAFEAHVAVFPDVYGHYDMTVETRRVLHQAGLLPWIDDKLLRRLVDRPNGRAEWVTGERVRLGEDSFGAARLQGRLYCTTDLLDKVGLQNQKDGERLHVFDDSRELWLTPVALADHPMVPLAEVLKHFERPYKFEGGRLELLP